MLNAKMMRWLPFGFVLVFALSIVFDNNSPISTLRIIQRWGIPHEVYSLFSIAGAGAMFVACRKFTFQAVNLFVAGLLPMGFYTLAVISRVVTVNIPLTTIVINVFLLIALAVQYSYALHHASVHERKVINGDG